MSASPKNIEELIAQLEKLDKKNLNDEYDLFWECREVFGKLKILSDFDPSDVKEVIKILKDLPEEKRKSDIKDLDKKETEMESVVPTKEKLEELIEEYEKASGKKKEIIEKKIYEKTGQKNVDQFIKNQKETAKRNFEELNNLSPDLKEKVIQKLSKIDEELSEKTREIIDNACLEDEIKKKGIEKQLKEEFRNKEKEQLVLKEVEKVRAEIKVEKKAEEIAKITYEKLKFDNSPVSENIKNELKEDILESWKNNTKIDPKKFSKGIQDEITITGGVRAAENFKTENLKSIVNYRSIKIEEEIGEKLRKNGVDDEKLISRFSSAVNELTNNPYVSTEESSREEISRFVDSTVPGKSPGEISIAVDESEFLRKGMVMPWKRFNNALDLFRKSSDEIGSKFGSDKIPNGIKEVRVLEKMTALFKDSPKMLKLMNNAQQFVGFIEKVNAFPGNILVKLGVRDFGFKILGKIGGQAAVDFVQNSAAILAKQGTFNGLRSIFTGLLSKGSVAIGSTAGSGAAAGSVAAGSGAAAAAGGGVAAVPVIGWIIAAIIALGIILKPVFKKINDWAKKTLNLNLNSVGDFFSKTLNLGTGGTVVAAGSFITLFSSLPNIIAGVGSVIAPVFGCVVLGSLTYSMFEQNLMSSLVPPRDMGNCVLKNENSGTINCDQNAPDNNYPGLKKDNYIKLATEKWSATGTSFAKECYNDVVNRSLCAGVNPAYSLWMWLNESGASNYNRDDIEDFGIHYIPENRNFNVQITEFLKKDPASACINDPRIGGNYWLALGANFMNGSDCNPDRPNSIFKSANPRLWLADFEKYWGEMTSTAIPNTIFVPKGGQNCDQVGKSTTALPGNSFEHVDEEGNVWVCTENSQEVAGGSEYNPNSPGLSGVVVDGECSVGDVVVATKQCDPKWSQTQLNGGSCANGMPGTICSAGCGPTSVSMLMRHVNGSLTPNNVIFSSGSAYANMGCEGSSLDQAQTELSKKFGSAAVTYNGVTQGCDEKAIAKWICDGKVVMVLANFYRNSKLELGGHYVMAVGVKNGKIVVQDPFYDSTVTPFDGTNAYGYAHDIKGCLLVDKAAVK